MKSVHQDNKYIKKLSSNLTVEDYSIPRNKKNLKNLVEEKTTLINIDSRFRTSDPKNIIKNDFKVLEENPLMVQKDSNLIRIYDKGHSYSVEDKIVVKNVKNKNNIFSNGLIFLKNSFYVLVYHKNHSIDLNYKRYNSTFEISLSSVIGVFDQNYIDNIPINLLNTIHDIIIYSDDILEILSIKSGYKVIVDEMYKYLDYLKNEENDKFQNIIQNYYLIRLPIKYKNINSQISLTTETDNTGIEFQTYTYPGNTTIEINNIGGIAFNLINANFPINYLQKQGFHTITKIERDYFYFESSIKAYKTIEKAGGNDVVISKVINFVEGYPNSNNYKILLKKTFYNIKSIELVSSEFPSTEKIIKSDGDLKNNIIQWQNIEDGDYIYSSREFLLLFVMLIFEFITFFLVFL